MENGKSLETINGRLSNNFVVFNKLKYPYYFASTIFHTVNRNEILNNEILFDKMVSNGFDQFKRMGDKIEADDIMFTANRDFLANKYKGESINFYKRIVGSDITSFYHLKIALEIKSKRISSFYLSSDNTGVRFEYFDDVHKFGDPYLLEIFGQRVRGGLEPRVTEFKVPVSKIDKFIAVKRYKNCEWLGTAREKEFNGIEEEIVLDMNNFDENIYQLFKDHGVLELSW